MKDAGRGLSRRRRRGWKEERERGGGREGLKQCDKEIIKERL